MSATATATDTAGSATATGTGTDAQASGSSIASSIASSLLSSITDAASSTLEDEATGTAASASSTTTGLIPDASRRQGIGLTSFLTAVATAVVVFSVQILLFLILRNKLARIFKPKTYLVPDRERTEPPPRTFFGMVRKLWTYSDREIIKKCGLDAYFFLRYLKTLLIIFIPICFVVMPILIPINYVGGQGQNIDASGDDVGRNETTGLDTLAWNNVSPRKTDRYAAHLLLGILVVIWVCSVFFFELRVYIKVRQDHLTSAEYRLRASATTVLVNGIPEKWLTEQALRGLFDVFPGGIRNVWINRDMSKLLDKVHERSKVHLKLESAETDLIKAAKKAQLKKAAAEEKAERKKMKLGSLSKKERQARDAQKDAEANRMANSAEGRTAGDKHNVPHTVDDGVHQAQHEDHDHDHGHSSDSDSDSDEGKKHGFKLPFIGDPLVKVGHGIKGVVAKAGNNVDDTLETTNGFIGLGQSNNNRGTRPSHEGHQAPAPVDEEDSPRSPTGDSLRAENTYSRNSFRPSGDSTREMHPKTSQDEPAYGGNTVRKLENPDDLYRKEDIKWWQFWKPPPGAYASPVPQGYDPVAQAERDTMESKPLWQKIKYALPFMSADDEEPVDYPVAYNEDYKEDQEEPAEWEKWLKKKDRPTHNLPLFGVSWLFGIPFVTKKVDTIYWCREQLARLNVEIEEDQKHPERYPLMNSAFIQFNHQVAAHMASQAVVHHLPNQMAPRLNEISPKDVIWDNMAFTWWQEWLRTALITAAICITTLLWAIPVAWTAALSQLDQMIQTTDWLSWIRDNEVLEKAAKALAGVLPAVVLALLLLLVPVLLDFLARFKGAKTGSQKTEFVQVFYFFFLFVQVFLVVSIASFFAASVDKLIENIQELDTVGAVLDLLANNLPKAANYFFSYMILQAMTTSAGTLLQIGALLVWFIIARIFDSTARNKWSRNTNLNDIQWGKFFPVYTNFACIALVYCVIAPLISIFAIITFSLLWFAQRYAMLYVTRFEHDTGGVLYPRAINQTFTGIYFMELCMAGLFFIVEDQDETNTCTTHGVIMIVVFLLTIAYQVMLNHSFSPLFRYLPITFEDEAVLRDEAFQRMQDIRLGLVDPDQQPETVNANNREKISRHDGSEDIEMQRVSGSIGRGMRRPVKQVGTWARDGSNQLRKLAIVNKAKDKSKQASEYRRKHRDKDIEEQRAIGEALFGGIHDEIEDLTPEERDALTRHAFKHEALRARRPTVWIPRDDLGISDDEIRRTQSYSEHIWISNEGTALDSKVRVVYGSAPPDFSEIDLINL